MVDTATNPSRVRRVYVWIVVLMVVGAAIWGVSPREDSVSDGSASEVDAVQPSEPPSHEHPGLSTPLEAKARSEPRPTDVVESDAGRPEARDAAATPSSHQSPAASEVVDAHSADAQRRALSEAETLLAQIRREPWTGNTERQYQEQLRAQSREVSGIERELSKLIETTGEAALRSRALVMLGDSYRVLAERVRSMPTPDGLDPAQHVVFAKTLDTMAASFEAKARQFYEVALAHSAKHDLQSPGLRAARAFVEETEPQKGP